MTMLIQPTPFLVAYFLSVLGAVSQQAPAHKDKPWPEVLPSVVDSEAIKDVRLAIISYEREIPTDYAPYVDDVFNDFTDNLSKNYGPRKIVNKTLVHIGGDAQVVLKFHDGPLPINGQTLQAMLKTMHSLFDNHSLRELYCGIEIGGQKAASLSLQMGPGPGGSMDVFPTSYPKEWERLNNDLSRAQQGPLSADRKPWPDLPAVIITKRYTTIMATSYGEDIPTDEDRWQGYIRSAFAHLIGVIRDHWGRRAPSGLVNRNVQQFGGSGGTRRVVLMYTVVRGKGVYLEALQDMLDAMFYAIIERSFRGLRCVIKYHGEDVANLELALWNGFNAPESEVETTDLTTF